MGDSGKVSRNISWIRLFPGASIVDRWIVADSYCLDHLVLLISVAFHAAWYFLGFVYLRASVLLFSSIISFFHFFHFKMFIQIISFI